MAAFIDENTQFVDTGGQPIVNGKLYIGSKNLDPIANPITIFSDRALTIPLANPQLLDSSGRSTNKIWIPGEFSFRVDNSVDVQQIQDLDAGGVSETGVTILTDVQGSNAISAKGSPTISAYIDGQMYIFQPAAGNTGATTLNIDSLGVKNINLFGAALSGGEFLAGLNTIVAYNSDNDEFDLLVSVTDVNGSIFLEEKAAADTDVAGKGQFWVRDDVPNLPLFTDDVGTDRILGTTLGIQTATTSGTSIDLTGISSGAKMIIITLEGVSTSGTSNPMFQIGDSGGIETTGYQSAACRLRNGIGVIAAASGTGFAIISNAATNSLHGTFILTKKSTANSWTCIANINNSALTEIHIQAGVKVLTGELTQVRLTTIGGTDTFDVGSINIQYS